MTGIVDRLSFLGKNLQGSEIRRLFAVSMRPGVISFAGGMPDPASFPLEEFARILNSLTMQKGQSLLQYGPSRGTNEGIAAAISLMERRGITTREDEIIVTSGAQQVINIAASVLTDPGDVIVCENPTFVGALGVFRNCRAELAGIPMDKDGIIPAILEETLNRMKLSEKRVKFLYIMPNFQNPSGILLSRERRRQIMDIARRVDILILEDDAYGELYFQGGPERVEPLKALDTENRVIYAGSFSKIISPGIRLGWACAAPELIERFDMARQMAVVCPNPLIQAAAAEMCGNGFLARHIETLRVKYAKRCSAMLASLNNHMPDGISWTQPEGGFYILVTLPKRIDALAMLDRALANNVAYVIGAAFSPDGTNKSTFRISFSRESEDVIEEGIRRLGAAVRETLNAS